MEKFKELVAELEVAKVEADKTYVNANMQAAKRLFASLMRVEVKGKIARKELSAFRNKIQDQKDQKKLDENQDM